MHKGGIHFMGLNDKSYAQKQRSGYRAIHKFQNEVTSELKTHEPLNFEP